MICAKYYDMPKLYSRWNIFCESFIENMKYMSTANALELRLSCTNPWIWWNRYRTPPWLCLVQCVPHPHWLILGSGVINILYFRDVHPCWVGRGSARRQPGADSHPQRQTCFAATFTFRTTTQTTAAAQEKMLLGHKEQTPIYGDQILLSIYTLALF